MEESSKNPPIDLRDVLRPIKARLWLIVVCVSLATALTYYHYSSQPKQYRATTSLYIGSTDPTQLTAATASDRETADLATLVNSNNVAELAAHELGFKGDPQALVGAVTAAPVSGSDFVTLSATSGNPQSAAELVNAVASAFVRTETNTIRQEAAQAQERAQRQLDAVPNTLANQATRSQLLATIQQMQGIASLPTAGIQVVDPASAPSVPFAPNPSKDAIFAFVIALMLTIAGAYGLERLDRRVRRLADVENVYGHPVLATVRRTTKPAPTTADGFAVLPDDIREAFRKLRMNLELAAIDRPPKTIVVTSAIPREGKSTVTRNLALGYREAGLNVCVVDADLRRPGLARLLNVTRTPGLTDVVVGDESLRGALKRAAAGVPGMETLARLQTPRSLDGIGLSTNSAPDVGDLLGDVGSLVVLPSGPEPSNPPVILGSDQMRTILSALADDFDVVIIDTSPLLAVSDAIPLLSAADGVIVVTRLAMTPRDAAEDVIEQIRRIPGANLLGIVANDVRGSDAGIKRYTYGYVAPGTDV